MICYIVEITMRRIQPNKYSPSLSWDRLKICSQNLTPLFYMVLSQGNLRNCFAQQIHDFYFSKLSKSLFQQNEKQLPTLLPHTITQHWQWCSLKPPRWFGHGGKFCNCCCLNCQLQLQLHLLLAIVVWNFDSCLPFGLLLMCCLQ